MNSKPRLGRKDIFTENKIAVKPGRKIPEKLFIQIKIKAAKERKRISDLVGEIFSQFLKRS